MPVPVKQCEARHHLATVFSTILVTSHIFVIDDILNPFRVIHFICTYLS